MTLYAVIFGGVALIGSILWFYVTGRNAGTSSAQGKEAQANVDAAKRIADTQAHDPTSHDALLDELRGGGKL